MCEGEQSDQRTSAMAQASSWNKSEQLDVEQKYIQLLTDSLQNVLIAKDRRADSPVVTESLRPAIDRSHRLLQSSLH